MDKQQFIIDQLKPYFLDHSLCGIEMGQCKNLTKEGKMCVFGKNLIEPTNPETDNEWTPADLRYNVGILKPESRGILNWQEWNAMQDVHDAVATDASNRPVILRLQRLEMMAGVDLTELKELLEK